MRDPVCGAVLDEKTAKFKIKEFLELVEITNLVK